MKHYKKALELAAEEAYKNEVLDTGMRDLVIGEGKDFTTAEEWKQARMQEWLEQAEIELAK
jgi:hypothetical protein